MSTISKLTKKSSSILKKSRTKSASTLRSTSPSVSTRENSTLPPNRFNCSQDVIDFFVDQMLDSIVDTYTPMECYDSCSCRDVSKECLEMIDFKDITSEDLISAEVVSIRGSTVVLRKVKNRLKSVSNTSTSKSSNAQLKVTPKSSKVMEAAGFIMQSSSKCSTSVGLLPTSSDEEEFPIQIVFNSGNIYEGFVKNKLMHGTGKYSWVDGTIYEVFAYGYCQLKNVEPCNFKGEFLNGFPSGKGVMVLPELSRYEGDFCHGLFNGDGVLNIVSTPILYCGHWNHGRKSGKGWILYGPGNYYDGDFANDLMDGPGVRQYEIGNKYDGRFLNSLRHGYGETQWKNGDFYRGEWIKGDYSGYGEYFWSTFKNDSFTFYPQSVYKGSWFKGKRHGEGILFFGSSNGSHYEGQFDMNFKHGDGTLTCGNGVILQSSNLFSFDKLSLSTSSDDPKITCDPRVKVPIFAIPETIDIRFYIDQFFDRIGDDTLAILKDFEEMTLRNTLILSMPILGDLYEKYSNFGRNHDECLSDLVMIRLFLWQFYRDVGISQYNSTSLVQTDRILAWNPSNGLNHTHDPFEYIYFWQFILSLVGVVISTISLEEQADLNHGGVCSYVFKRFLNHLQDDLITQTLPSFKYKDLVPIKEVYALYCDLGEPLIARDLLKKICLKKFHSPPCNLEMEDTRYVKFSPGVNSVPIFGEIRFIPRKHEEFIKKSNLYEFRRLKIRNIIKSLSTVCPLITLDGLVVNLDYPLTFLEFYDVLLDLIFKLMELELKDKKRSIIGQMKIEEPIKETVKSLKKTASEKSSVKTGKTNKKRRR